MSTTVSSKSKGHPPAKWRMVLINEVGERVNIKHSKRVIILTIFAVMIGLTPLMATIKLYRAQTCRSQRLNATIRQGKAQKAALLAKIKHLKHELVQVELRQLETAGDAATSPAAAGSNRTKTEEQASSPNTGAPVALENINVDYDPGTRILRVRYKIRNARKSAERVSGRSFFVLKTAKNSPAGQLVFPQSRLHRGRPVDVDKGRYFSIRRFKIVNFSVTDLKLDDTYRYAAVWVYDLDGGLLRRKTFEVDLS